MPPHWVNKALPATQYFILNFFIISFIFIENKCLSDAMWDLKKEKKGGFQTRVDCVNKHVPYIYTTETDI